MVQMILHEYKIFNAEVLFREDCTADELIDVISANRVYLPCLYVYNKIDQISIEEVDRVARKPNSVVVRWAFAGFGLSFCNPPPPHPKNYNCRVKYENIYCISCSSCNLLLNLDYLLEVLWEYLALIRVYTKKPGQAPDFNDCLILRRGVTVEHVCHAIHRSLVGAFKYALVWVQFSFCWYSL